jgi:plastocyanin
MSPDTVLYVESGLAFGLLCGAGLARLKNFRLHGCLQGLIVVGNLGLIGAAMRPSLMSYLESSSRGTERFFVYAHAAVGTIAELLGLYVVMAAGSGGPVKWLRLNNYKLWMRTALLVWLSAFGLGVGTYYKLNASPAPAPAPAPAPPQAAAPKITIKNFEFDPKELTVPVGTEVEWVDEGGRHSVISDTGAFKSMPLAAGGSFKHKFDKAGRFMYFCEFHGSKGGHDMAGVVIVTAK